MVSIIVPNYNHSKYIKDRIQSIVRQDYQDFELIILDDFSTDNSKQIIEEFRSYPQISHIIYNDKNSGSTFRQWKKGIELARGEWIWIAESDDYCETSFLSTLLKSLEKDPDIVAAFAQSICFGECGKILWESFSNSLETVHGGTDFIKERMYNGNAIYNTSMAIFKKEAFYKVSERYTTYKFCGDWLLWYEIIKQGKIFESGKKLNYFRKHGNDVSGKSYRSGLYFKEMISIITYLKETQESFIACKLTEDIIQKFSISRKNFDNKFVAEVERGLKDLDASYVKKRYLYYLKGALQKRFISLGRALYTKVKV